MHVMEADALSCGADEIEHGASREGLPTLREEQPWQAIFAGGQVAPDRTQLVTGDWMLDRSRIFQTPHPEPRLIEVHVIASQSNGLRDAKPVSVHHEDQQIVAHVVSTALRPQQQAIDLALAQEVLVALARISCRLRGRLIVLTFPISTFGHPRSPPRKPSSHMKLA
jgi:hypothetical protein